MLPTMWTAAHWIPLHRRMLLVRIKLLVCYSKREKEAAIELRENLHFHDTNSLSRVLPLCYQTSHWLRSWKALVLTMPCSRWMEDDISSATDFPISQLQGVSTIYTNKYLYKHLYKQTPRESCWLWVTAGVAKASPAEVTETKGQTHGDHWHPMYGVS